VGTFAGVDWNFAETLGTFLGSGVRWWFLLSPRHQGVNGQDDEEVDRSGDNQERNQRIEKVAVSDLGAVDFGNQVRRVSWGIERRPALQFENVGAESKDAYPRFSWCIDPSTPLGSVDMSADSASACPTCPRTHSEVALCTLDV